MKRSKTYCLFYILQMCIGARSYTEPPRDLLTTRANTLMDDADDLQKQLDYEAKHKHQFGKPTPVWVLHIPIQKFGTTSVHRKRRDSMINVKKRNSVLKHECNQKLNLEEWKRRRRDENENSVACRRISANGEVKTDWSYKDQNDWSKTFPACGGRSQSPVNIPSGSMIRAKGARKMMYSYYNIRPKSMVVMNEGKTLSLLGDWAEGQRPIICGGAAHNRRYVFHSLQLHWPSEHTIGGLQYPLESQAVHVSVEYPTMEDALKASTKDKMAVLIVANIYQFADHDQAGLVSLLQATSFGYGNSSVEPLPLSYFSPPLKEYGVYHGSLTAPPCTESALWLVRARALPVTRESMHKIQERSFSLDPGQIHFRATQPLNDRMIYFYN